MGSFFRSVGASFARHDQTIRESLLANLSENIKEIQFEYINDDSNQGNCKTKIIQSYPHPFYHAHSTDIPLPLCDSTNSLCTTIEAIFLHGLKDSFLRQTINVIAGEIDRRPEPNFWPPLLVFSHKHTIQQVGVYLFFAFLRCLSYLSSGHRSKV